MPEYTPPLDLEPIKRDMTAWDATTTEDGPHAAIRLAYAMPAVVQEVERLRAELVGVRAATLEEADDAIRDVIKECRRAGEGPTWRTALMRARVAVSLLAADGAASGA